MMVSTLNPMPLGHLSERPLVSVVVANYNYGRYIGLALESVLSQSYSNYEVLVCDDGSTDDSLEILKRFAARDTRVQWVAKSNGGMASALNAAYAMSCGEIVCLLDSDDLYSPDKLEAVVNAFRENPDAGMAVHLLNRIDGEGRGMGVLPHTGRLPSGWCGPELVRTGGILFNMPPCSALSLRREIADRLFPISETFRANADGIVERIAPLLTPVASIQKRLGGYRLHGNNLTNTAHIDPTYIDRELAVWRHLWSAQSDALRAIDPEIAAKLAPVEPHYAYQRMVYTRHRLLGAPERAKAYKPFRTQPFFRAEPLFARMFWDITFVLPDVLFVPAFKAFTQPSAWKRLLKRCFIDPSGMRTGH
jgi:glycosyltransferase involved in cell wall biosynthesis